MGIGDRKLILVLIVVAFMVAACAGNFGVTAKNTLLTTQEAYVAGWGAFVDLHDQGVVNDEDFRKGYKLATVYYDAWMEASYAVEAYLDAPTGKNKQVAEYALNRASAALSRVLGYINEFIETEEVS